MGQKIESLSDLLKLGLQIPDLRYLLLAHGLWVSSFEKEKHKDILRSSDASREEVLVAGGMTITPKRIIVDGEGSTSIPIEKRPADKVKEHLEGMRGNEQVRITSI